MAKFERELQGNFDSFLENLHKEILSGSVTASFQEGSDHTLGDTRLAVRVYERYSAMGKARLSVNITLIGKGEQLFLSAIASGGSGAMFFKINTLGENNFLDKVIAIVKNFERNN